MIYDILQNMVKYKGISRNLDTAITFLQHADWSRLPAGRTEIDADRVCLQVMEAQTKAEEEGVYEYHKKYMDIQLVIEGCEQLYIGDGITEVVRGFSGDIGLVRSREAARCVLKPGTFVICRAGELHMPGIRCGTAEGGFRVRKAVVKVAAEDQL